MHSDPGVTFKKLAVFSTAWFIATTVSLSAVAQNTSSGSAIPQRRQTLPAIAQPDDNTLIVCLAPGADKNNVKEVLDEVHGTVISTLHLNTDNYDILFVQPEGGKADDTAKKITAKKSKDFKSIDHNRKFQLLQSVPNDPDFPSQWELGCINWPAAYATFKDRQPAAARFTICDTGCTPVPTANEFVNAVQYDCLGASVVPEAPGDAFGHGTNLCYRAAQATNNQYSLAGVASLKPELPARVIMLQIVSADGLAYSSSIAMALTWAINHHTERGGNGVVSMSMGRNANPPMWADSYLQNLGTSLNNAGDHLFLGAGNGGQDASAYPQGSITVVQATDQADNLYSFSARLSSPEACPGGSTSVATARYSSAVSLVQSMNPSLTALQATQIVLSTSKTTAQGKKIPQLDKAIAAALPVRAPFRPNPRPSYRP